MASSWNLESRAVQEERLARQLEAEAHRAEREAWRYRSQADQYRHRAQDPWAWQAERDRALRQERALLDRGAQARWEAARHHMNADYYQRQAAEAHRAEQLLRRQAAAVW